jgi:hypothetical protein
MDAIHERRLTTHVYISVKETTMNTRYALTLCTALVVGGALLTGSAPALGQADETGVSRLERAKTITGELVRVEYGDYFVKGQDGKEVHLTTDKTTQMMGQIKKGDRIEAKVTAQNHALSIRQAQ